MGQPVRWCLSVACRGEASAETGPWLIILCFFKKNRLVTIINDVTVSIFIDLDTDQADLFAFA